MTQTNKIESEPEAGSHAPAARRELALAGVLLILLVSLTAGVACSVVYHAATGAIATGWRWKSDPKVQLDTAPGDKTDKGTYDTFKNVDLADLDSGLHLLSATQAMLKMDYGLALSEIENISPAFRSTDSGAMTLEVECRLSLKQSEKVIKMASREIARNPKDYSGWLWRAQAYEQLKQYEKANADYAQVLVAFPYSKRGMLTQVPAAFCEKIEQAMFSLVHRRMGADFERMGDYKQASIHYLKAIDISMPQLAAARAKSGESSASTAKESIKELSNAIAANPSDNLYIMRGQAQKRLGKFKEALTDFNHVKPHGPAVELFVDRAAISFALADYKSAARDLRKAQAEDPMYEMAHMRQKKYSFAVMPMTSMKKSKVLNRFDKLIQDNPNDTENYLHRGVLQMAFRQYDEAARDLEHFLSMKAGVKTVPVAKANIDLAICRGLQKRKAEYEIVLTKAAENYGDFKWWQAVISYLEGKDVSDTALLNSARDDKARLAQAHYYIGQRLAIQGFPAKAQEQFKAGVDVGATVDESYLCKLALLPDPETAAGEEK